VLGSLVSPVGMSEKSITIAISFSILVGFRVIVAAGLFISLYPSVYLSIFYYLSIHVCARPPMPICLPFWLTGCN
jgi:hypothetical protein